MNKIPATRLIIPSSASNAISPGYSYKNKGCTHLSTEVLLANTTRSVPRKASSTTVITATEKSTYLFGDQRHHKQYLPTQQAVPTSNERACIGSVHSTQSPTATTVSAFHIILLRTFSQLPTSTVTRYSVYAIQFSQSNNRQCVP